MNVRTDDLMAVAADLVSDESQPNPDYDRALVELVTFATGGNTDDRGRIAARLGVTSDWDDAHGRAMRHLASECLR